MAEAPRLPIFDPTADPSVPVPGTDPSRTPEGLIPGFNLSFMNPEAMDTLRENQVDPVNQAGYDAVKALTPEEAADHASRVRMEARDRAVTDSVDYYFGTHVPRAWLGDHPELEGRLKDVLLHYSYHSMSGQEYNFGFAADHPGSDATNRRPGRERLQEDIDALMSEYGAAEPDVDPIPDPDVDPDPDPMPEIDPTLGAEVGRLREKLAGISYERRQLIRKNGRKARRLRDEYDELKEQYEAAVVAAGRAHVAVARDRGIEEVEINRFTVDTILSEHRAFSNAELRAMDRDGSRRGTIARFLASSPRLLASVGAAGFVGGFITRYAANKALKGAALAAIGATAPVAVGAGIGLGLAASSTRAVIASTVGNRADNIRKFDRRRDTDIQALTEGLEGVTGNGEELVANSHRTMQNVIDNRVEADRKSNRNRVVGAMAIGALAGGLGAGAELWMQHDGLLPGFGHHAASAKAGGNGSGTGTGGTSGGSSGGGAAGGHPGAGHLPKIDASVNVTHGEGYDQVFSNIASSHGIHLTGAQSWDMYQHLNNQLHGNFFSNNPSYQIRPGDMGISHTGQSTWSPAAIRAAETYLKDTFGLAA